MEQPGDAYIGVCKWRGVNHHLGLKAKETMVPPEGDGREGGE